MKEKDLKVNFGNIIPISTIDWPGRSVCTVFFNRCNFNCRFCQNYELLYETNLIDIDIIKDKILESKKFISAVVFSGGEPTMQCRALEELCKFVREHRLLIGIETNGYFTGMIKRLIEKNYIDKIFIDIKTSPLDEQRYSNITGYPNNVTKNIIETLNIIFDGDIDVEIRTTIFKHNITDALEIAKFLKEFKKIKGKDIIYVIQKGIPENAPDIDIRKEKPLKGKELKEIAKIILLTTGITTKIIDGKNYVG